MVGERRGRVGDPGTPEGSEDLSRRFPTITWRTGDGSRPNDSRRRPPCFSEIWTDFVIGRAAAEDAVLDQDSFWYPWWLEDKKRAKQVLVMPLRHIEVHGCQAPRRAFSGVSWTVCRPPGSCSVRIGLCYLAMGARLGSSATCTNMSTQSSRRKGSTRAKAVSHGRVRACL
jgi:hypothetical protein